jgi:putative FmdB family regulatory protein
MRLPPQQQAGDAEVSITVQVKESHGMPIYEYECRSCGVHFDRKQRWQDEPVRVCPECEGEVRKVIQPVGIVFKGSGFYKTDNSSSGERLARKNDEEEKTPVGDKEAKTPAGADSREPSKTEGKPDSQSEPRLASDSRSDSKSEPKSDSKSGSDAKPDTKSEAKPQAKSGESGRDQQQPR